MTDVILMAQRGDIKSVEVGPEERKKVEFTEFSDLRVIELRKKKEEEERKELRDRQERLIAERKRKEEQRQGQLDRLEAERKRKEQAAKIKEYFKNTRVEIRTYGHSLDRAAYSLYFYFDPRFAIGYFHETENNNKYSSNQQVTYL